MRIGVGESAVYKKKKIYIELAFIVNNNKIGIAEEGRSQQYEYLQVLCGYVRLLKA